MSEPKANGSTSEARMLFIHAQTPLHPGSGTALGVVDLPVQRERHTGWPLIPGSSLKGVLRDAARDIIHAENGKSRKEINKDDAKITAVFGPGEPEKESIHPGALVLTDARILAFPVRSLKGVFAWVTCPAVLERLYRDLELAGAKPTFNVPQPDPEKAACAKDSPLLIDGNDLLLEEFEFQRTDDSAGVAEWIAGNATSDQATADRLKKNSVVLHNDDFGHFVKHATEVVARIGLDAERKTVKQGALFYQEFLPTETLLYAVAIAHASRDNNNGGTLNAGQVINYLDGSLKKRPVLQIGGDETIGKGICRVHLSNGRGAHAQW